MAFERIVEEIIRRAMQRAEFSDLPGQGKPIDLSAYFQAPEDARMAPTLLKNTGSGPRGKSDCQRSGISSRGSPKSGIANPDGHSEGRSRVTSSNLISALDEASATRRGFEAQGIPNPHPPEVNKAHTRSL